MKNNDAIFEKIAKTYVDNLGKATKADNETLHIAIDTQMLDKKFKEKLESEEQKDSGRKIIKFSKALMPIAACLVIVCIWAITQNTIKGPAYESAAPAEEEPAYESEAPAEEAAAAEEPVAEEPPAEEPPASDQILSPPALPENISIVNQEIVDGVSIYHLIDDKGNDIIMEMNYGQIDEQEIATMQETQINGYTVYKEDVESQKRIIFEHEGIVYTLKNSKDINILIPICEYIFI